MKNESRGKKNHKLRWLQVLEWVAWVLLVAWMGPQAWERVQPWLLDGPLASSPPEGVTSVPVSLESKAKAPWMNTGDILRLGEPPATEYGNHEWTDMDRYFGDLVDQEPRAEYDPALAHAARELAAVYARTGGLATDGPFTFIMNSAGTSDWGVKQALMLTTQEGDAPIKARLRELLAQEDTDKRPARIGIGEVHQLKRPIRRSIAILVSRSDLYLDPIPRTLMPGLTASLRGTMPRGATGLKAIRMGPEEVMETLEAKVSGERFEIRVPAGLQRGVVWVELIATLSHGPTPLAQLGFNVGEEVPSEWQGTKRDEEGDLQTTDEAEDYALFLLNRDREYAGVPRLARRDDLDGLARLHCEDMRDEGYFGHHSARTGSVSDRMNDAGVSFRRLGENLARNSSIGGAQEGLMFSLGHRKNCLSKSFEYVGIGVAKRDRGTGVDWYLCQVFMSPP